MNNIKAMLAASALLWSASQTMAGSLSVTTTSTTLQDYSASWIVDVTAPGTARSELYNGPANFHTTDYAYWYEYVPTGNGEGYWRRVSITTPGLNAWINGFANAILRPIDTGVIYYIQVNPGWSHVQGVFAASATADLAPGTYRLDHNAQRGAQVHTYITW